MTSGRGTVGAASPSRVWTETRGRAAAAMGVVFTKLGFKGLGFETLNINIISIIPAYIPSALIGSLVFPHKTSNYLLKND